MKKKLIFLLAFITLIPSVNAETTAEKIHSLISKYDNVIVSFLIDHPVGSIYETTASDESTPAQMKAKYGGEWVVYGENRTLRGTTGTAGETGGNSSITLLANQIPSHNHSITPSGTISSTFTGTSSTTGNNSRGHTHSVKGNTADNNRGHTHTVSGTTGANSAGHTHAVSISGTAATTTALTGKYTFHGGENYSTAYTVSGVVGGGVRISNAYTSFNKKSASSGAPSIGIYSVDASHYHTYKTKASTSEGQSQNHTHTFSGTTGGVKANHTHSINTTSDDENQTHTHTATAEGTVSSTFSGSQGTTNETGSDTPSSFSVTDPYITVYRYKRTK